MPRSSASSTWCVLELNRKVTTSSKPCRRASSGAAFLAVDCPHRQARLHSAGEAAHMLDAVSVLRSMEGEEADGAASRRLRRRQCGAHVARTAKRLGASEAIIVYRRNREKCPRTTSKSRRHCGRRADRWLSTIKNMADEGTLTVEKMKLDDKGFPQPTGEFETLESDSSCWRWGRTWTCRFSTACRLAIKDGTVQVGPNMTGHAGVFAGGDMVPSERTVTVGVGHGKRPRPPMPGCAGRSTLRRSTRWPNSASSTPVLRRCAQDRAARHRTGPAYVDFDEVVGSTKPTLFEARLCLSCGNCSSATTAGVCPTMR